ncbi:hypothetical protein HGRIS_010534 [Hohenbuehelia grisea]|uniref:Laccase n=1 Tax=Hohenbuehelia grisea TaxID=104357 RepID=A0ABR3IX09_9AGAR
MVLSSVILALALSPGVFAVTRQFELNIVNAPVAPDGFQRMGVLANGTFPGPVITAMRDDSVEINTHNLLANPGMRRSTSIHWLHKTTVMDGPAFVNQCPIPPNTTFLYAFDMAGQTGNFWYHSHLSTQYCDGLRGAFIVYDPDDPLKNLYDVDDATTIITLADWYHELAPAAQNGFFETGTVPVPDSFLINGVGRFVGGPEVPWAVVNVEMGKRYRLRLIQISCRPFTTFSIDNHNITVIEADGIEHDPVEVQNADIFAAQRLSVILNANQPVDNYWIRAPTGGTGNPNLDPNLARAILRYKGAPAVDPVTNTTNGTKLDDADLHPIAQVGPGMLGDGPPDVAITLNITQPNPPFFDINGISYLSPSVPVILQLLSGAVKPQDVLPTEQLFFLPKNKLIEVSIPGTGAHPFHLHGHAFDIVRVTNHNETNFVNPPRRDVLPINGGNTTFRFFSGNPGSWFLHCHIDWHLEAGLAIVFAEAPEDNVSGPDAQIVPQDWNTLCPSYDALPPEEQ